jgi:hypothetical protein
MFVPFDTTVISLDSSADDHFFSLWVFIFFCSRLFSFAIGDDTFKMFVPFDTTVISLDSSTEDHSGNFCFRSFFFVLAVFFLSFSLFRDQ